MARRTHLAPASGDQGIVYGACRPGYFSVGDPIDAVADWIDQMEEAGIERVCCLLEATELSRYQGLLERYESAFGADRVCHVPIADRTTIGRDVFQISILPFLKAAASKSEPVVVHCSAGMGRTGQVLVLWLVTERGYGLDAAIRAVREAGRRPLEAASREELRSIVAD